MKNLAIATLLAVTASGFATTVSATETASTVAERHRNLEHPANVFVQPDASRFKMSHATD